MATSTTDVFLFLLERRFSFRYAWITLGAKIIDLMMIPLMSPAQVGLDEKPDTPIRISRTPQS